MVVSEFKQNRQLSDHSTFPVTQSAAGWTQRRNTTSVRQASLLSHQWHETHHPSPPNPLSRFFFNRKPKVDENAEPGDGLMNMLKKIYSEGDDEMKRTINKAWTESQDKKSKGEDMMDFWAASPSSQSCWGLQRKGHWWMMDIVIGWNSSLLDANILSYISQDIKKKPFWHWHPKN